MFGHVVDNLDNIEEGEGRYNAELEVSEGE